MAKQLSFQMILHEGSLIVKDIPRLLSTLVRLQHSLKDLHHECRRYQEL